MKKGLLSILAASAVLVGCQNYDDQFDALNTQITSLKTQVEGLAGVQSDVNALKGLISSLQGAVDGVNSDLSSQLAEALADIEAVEAAVADVASGEDLAAVQADLDAVGSDVDELLESDAFFNGDLNITSDATLAFAQQLGQKVKVINGDVKVTGWDGMDSEAVNAITAQMLTITGNVNVRMPSQSYAAITFPELTSADVITIAQAGSYSFPKLQSATTINLGKNYSSKVTMVDFRELTTVTNFKTVTVATDYSTSGTETDTLNFDEAEEMHLTKIGYYTPKTLTIVVEEGATLDLSAFTSQDSEGVVRSVTLNVTGASNVTLPNYKNGSFTATDVETVDLANFYGNVTISGVENLTLGKSATDITISDTAALTEATITGITAPEDTTDKTGPALDLTGQTNLENLTLSGLFTTIDVEDASNLVELTFDGTANSLTMRNNGDLSEVDLAGAKIIDVTLDNADDLSEVTLAHTVATGKPNGQSTAVTAGSLVITGNAKLVSVVAAEVNLIKTLTIQNNAKLEIIDMAKLKAVGGSSDKANVLIGGSGANEQNKLNATKITDKLDPSTTDIGSIESDSKLETLKTYLNAASKVPGSTGIQVFFDSADLHVTEVDGGTDTEQNNLEITTSGDVAELTVMDITATTTSGNTVRQTRSYVFVPHLDAAKEYTALVAADDLVLDYDLLTAQAFKVTDSYNGDTVDDLTELITYFNDKGDKEDFDVTLARDAYITAYYRINYNDASGVAENVSAAGNLKFLFGSVSAAAVLAANDDAGSIATAIASVIDNMASYVASADGDFVKVQPEGPTAGDADLSPIPLVSLPSSLGVYKVDTDTTAILSATATNSASDYALAVGSKLDRRGMRVTIVNNLTTSSRTTTWDAGSGGAFAVGNRTELIAGTNMRTHTGFTATTVNTRQYSAGFGDISTAQTNTGNSTNKSGWL